MEALVGQMVTALIIATKNDEENATEKPFLLVTTATMLAETIVAAIRLRQDGVRWENLEDKLEQQMRMTESVR